MYKIKKKYLGRVLKDRGVSITLDKNSSQYELHHVFKSAKWGKEFVTFVKPKVEDDKNTESPSE